MLETPATNSTARVFHDFLDSVSGHLLAADGNWVLLTNMYPLVIAQTKQYYIIRWNLLWFWLFFSFFK
jgi:hypothetical protein